ncbi:MAG: mobile mystery protein B, partial [Actinomycetota bacterium]|nr:mobile mystery protein B [Actinomycetota bacterium]
MTSTSPLGDDRPNTTPLEAEDFAQLIPTDVATRSDLNAVERDNILAARLWAFTGHPFKSVADLLHETALDDIHRRMFGDVWRWAGMRRTRATNIGVDPILIVPALRDALDDAKYWHEHATFEPIEHAVRLHHRLVLVHPYVNGNGRHARFVADVYLRIIGEPLLPWRRGESEESETRTDYIAALREADTDNYAPLIAYASSRAQ